MKKAFILKVTLECLLHHTRLLKPHYPWLYSRTNHWCCLCNRSRFRTNFLKSIGVIVCYHVKCFRFEVSMVGSWPIHARKINTNTFSTSMTLRSILQNLQDNFDKFSLPEVLMQHNLNCPLLVLSIIPQISLIICSIMVPPPSVQPNVTSQFFQHSHASFELRKKKELLTNIFNLLQQQSVRINCVEENQDKILTKVVTQIKIWQHPEQRESPL